MMSTGAMYEVVELGVSTPKTKELSELVSGQVGWINASIKTIDTVKVGDTITTLSHEAKTPLPGYQPMKPMVYSGLFPIEPNKFEPLKEALEKLKLNDAPLEFEPETSEALGFGFRCGFLGLLHMEIIEERIEREFGIDIITTSPSVIYEVKLTNGEVISVDSPSKCQKELKLLKLKNLILKPIYLSQVNILELLWSYVKIKEESINQWIT